MLFSVLHLPPLPTLVFAVDREDNTIIDNNAVESSHTIIASLIEWYAVMNDKDLNMKRMAKQVKCLNEFNAELQKLEPDCPAEDLYQFYVEHTRKWVETYFNGYKMFFKNADFVVVGDKMHKTMLDYSKAQYWHFTDGAASLDISENVPYLELLKKCAAWAQEGQKQNQEDQEDTQTNEEIDTTQTNITQTKI